MKVFKVWEDFESESMNEKDLLQFAIGLWKDGAIKIEQMMIDNKKVTRYSLKYYQDEER
jgi:hypothetical protein